MKEILQASFPVLSMKDKKALRAGIPSKVLKLACEYKPKLLIGAFNACLTAGVFLLEGCETPTDKQGQWF